MPRFTPSTVNTEIRQLAELFKALSYDQIVTFGEMSAEIGADIKKRPWIIQDAIVLAKKEAGAIYANVRGVGYKRIAAEEYHALGHSLRKRGMRSFNRGAKDIQRALDTANDISSDAELRAYREISTLGMLAHLCRDTTVSKAPQTGRPEPVAKTMRAMMSALGA